MSFVINWRTITKIILETMIVTSHACRNIYMKITIVSYCGFLEHLSITFTDKTDLSDPLNREDY